jgi:hypothetical protein
MNISIPKLAAAAVLVLALALALACSGGESGVAVTGVGLPKALAVGVGAAETLTAAIAPPDATNKNVAWASSNPDKVAVAGGPGMVELPVGPAAAKYVEARDMAVAPNGSVYVCGVDIVVTEEDVFAFAPEMWRDGALQHIGGWSGARDMGGAYAVLVR